jgi:hypothetical protein
MAWAEEERRTFFPFFPAGGSLRAGLRRAPRVVGCEDYSPTVPLPSVGIQKVGFSCLMQYQWLRRQLRAYCRVLERLGEVWTLGIEPAGTA